MGDEGCKSLGLSCSALLANSEVFGSGSRVFKLFAHGVSSALNFARLDFQGVQYSSSVVCRFVGLFLWDVMHVSRVDVLIYFCRFLDIKRGGSVEFRPAALSVISVHL